MFTELYFLNDEIYLVKNKDYNPFSAMQILFCVFAFAYKKCEFYFCLEQFSHYSEV